MAAEMLPIGLGFFSRGSKDSKGWKEAPIRTRKRHPLHIRCLNIGEKAFMNKTESDQVRLNCMYLDVGMQVHQHMLCVSAPQLYGNVHLLVQQDEDLHSGCLLPGKQGTACTSN